MEYVVYRITNTLKRKHYYGAKGFSGNSREQLGTTYFSSSKDEQFLREQKAYPSRFRYKIIFTFNAWHEAAECERRLHERFDVGNNDAFYNIVASGDMIHLGSFVKKENLCKPKRKKRVGVIPRVTREMQLECSTRVIEEIPRYL